MTRRLAIVERRGTQWVPVKLVGGDIADTLLEMLDTPEVPPVDRRGMMGSEEGRSNRPRTQGLQQAPDSRIAPGESGAKS
jgi:hypothetical protein